MSKPLNGKLGPSLMLCRHMLSRNLAVILHLGQAFAWTQAKAKGPSSELESMTITRKPNKKDHPSLMKITARCPIWRIGNHWG